MWCGNVNHPGMKRSLGTSMGRFHVLCGYGKKRSRLLRFVTARHVTPTAVAWEQQRFRGPHFEKGKALTDACVPQGSMLPNSFPGRICFHD
jgi:hypothetical protein